MILLSLECAASGCSVCVLDSGKLLALETERMERGQDARLVPLVQEVMTKARLDLKELDRLAVTRGPGSFTGVRIGLATALGFGLALGKPVLGVDRFSLYRKGFAGGGPLLIVLESKRLELFCQIVRNEQESPSMLTPEEITTLIAQNPGIKIVGDAYDYFAVAGVAVEPLALPEVHLCGLLAEAADPIDPLFAPKPLYLRPPDVTMPPPRS